MRASMVRQSNFAASYALVALACVLVGCATGESPACRTGERSMLSDLLYFGLSKPAGGVITQEEWDDFLRVTVTPRFPAGLTAWPASGQWRGADGRIVREESRVLQLLHPDDAESERSIRDISDEYKRRFAQEAVLRVRSRACTSISG